MGTICVFLFYYYHFQHIMRLRDISAYTCMQAVINSLHACIIGANENRIDWSSLEHLTVKCSKELQSFLCKWHFSFTPATNDMHKYFTSLHIFRGIPSIYPYNVVYTASQIMQNLIFSIKTHVRPLRSPQNSARWRNSTLLRLRS